MNDVVVGMSHGDEAKSKITDYLISRGNYKINVRYNGGANAGHTIVLGDQTFKLHHLPSGAVSDKKVQLFMTNGMLINPVVLCEEIDNLKLNGIDISNRTFISDKAHCVMPWHIVEDKATGASVGTTGRGIGPCVADKINRNKAIRMGDLYKYIQNMDDDAIIYWNSMLGNGLHEKLSIHKYMECAEKLSTLITDTRVSLKHFVENLGDSDVLFESAHGIHLDIDHGSYPFVTTTGIGPSAIPQATGIPIIKYNRIIGIIKCYATRVGNGPFPSEIEGDIAEHIRIRGSEFGTTTGRPRRIGWLDFDMTKLSIELTGATEIALTRADILYGMDKIGIRINNEIKYFNGWNSIEDESFESYVKLIEETLGIPVSMVSYGAERNCVREYHNI